MEKSDILIKIQEMTILEKMANLTEADFAHVQSCIEQAVQEEQDQHKENNKEGTNTN